MGECERWHLKKWINKKVKRIYTWYYYAEGVGERIYWTGESSEFAIGVCWTWRFQTVRPVVLQ